MKYKIVLLLMVFHTCFIKNVVVSRIENEDQTLETLKIIETRMKNIFKYITKISLSYMLRITEEVNISSSCTRSVIWFLSDLTKLKMWSLKLLDSFGKVFPSVSKGNLWFRGDYDECLKIEFNENRKNLSRHESKVIRGKYCSISIKLNRIFKNSEGKYNITVVRLFTDFLKPLKLSQFEVSIENYDFDWRFDICIPSTCSEKDVQNVLEWATQDVNVSMVVEKCYMKDEIRKYSSIQIACLSVFGFLIIWVTFSTVLDILLRSKIFSKIHIKGNWFKNCVSHSSCKQALLFWQLSNNTDKTIKCFCGMKFLLISIIVYGHLISLSYINMETIEKPIYITELFDDLPVEIASQAVVMIETFFFISGFLLFYRETDINSNIQYVIFLLKRFMRCSISAYSIMAVVVILPHFGNGPLWQSVVEEAEYIERNWWKYLLHVQNFYVTRYTFTGHLWFLDALMQLSILTVPLFFIRHRWPRIAPIVLCILISIGFVLHMTGMWTENYYSWTGIAFNTLKNRKYLTQNYILPYFSHLSSYCFGLLIGSILLNHRKIKLGKIFCIFFWIVSISLMGLAVFGLHGYINDESPNEKILLLQKSLAPFAWTIGLAMMSVACVTGNGGILNRFLSLKIFVILDRFTIWIYVFHPVITLYIFGNLRNPFPITQINLWMVFLFIMFLSLIASFLSIIIIQSPFNAVEKIFRSKSRIVKPHLEMNVLKPE